ncbi:MAG: outer membrane protein OmpA-like peptidoglycan-associated protein [Cyclobacteriaceae bacterium]|jgi:outer membrane protein OmpA-like peptidoglycan-associated protein
MNNSVIFLSLWVLSLLPFGTYAQRSEPSKRKAAEEATVQDSIPPNVVLNIYEFKNINSYPEYYNEAKLVNIQALEKEKDVDGLFNALKDYVNRFGVRNFYKDTRLIWRLAKLTELLGDYEEAKSLYRLVLRHHHADINIREIELYYDSLNIQAAAQYVPIEYYYEMVEHRKLIDTLRPPRGILLNMGPAINSRNADYAPALNINSSTMIFTSKRNELDLGIRQRDNEDLFISTRDASGIWNIAKPVTMINSRYNEGSACLSNDGQTLYFSRCECLDCYGDCDIFQASLQADSTWGDVQNLGINVNSLSWDSHPSLSKSGDTLYFASDRLGGFGLSDIYFSHKLPNNKWAKSRNMGPVINTRNNEVSPFYHPVFEVLYFSSNGQLYNFGEFDIFKSNLINGGWSEPLNIGPLVNGRGSEFYFTIDSRSESLYYARSSTRDLSKLDLYSFPLPMEAQPMANTRVTGALTDSITGEPFTGIVSIIDLDQGIEVAPKYLNPDGSFEFDLIDQRNYLLVIQGDDFFRIEEAFFLEGPMDLRRVTEPLAARVKFESIEFENGKSGLRPGMYADLNKIVNFLYDNITFKLKIAGHTDSYGADEFNLELSRVRAKNIRDYMVIFAGIADDRVEWEGYGSGDPIVEEITEQDMKINRRVEFQIYRPGTPTPITPSDSTTQKN